MCFESVNPSCWWGVAFNAKKFEVNYRVFVLHTALEIAKLSLAPQSLNWKSCTLKTDNPFRTNIMVSWYDMLLGKENMFWWQMYCIGMKDIFQNIIKLFLSQVHVYTTFESWYMLTAKSN